MLIGVLVAITAALSACGVGGSPSSTEPAAGGSPSPTESMFARLHQQAQAALARWAEAVATAGGPQGFVPTGELTGQIGDWEVAVGGNDKIALMGGLVETSTSLPNSAPPDSQIRWQDGTTATVPLISATQALTDIRSTATGGCSGCGEVKALQIIGARLTSGQIDTSRGRATVPMWAFAVQGTAVDITRVAVATKITVVPPTWNPYDSPVGISVGSATGTSGGHELVVTFVGAHGPASEPCGADYTAEAVESATAVVVIVYEHPYPGGGACDLVGYARTATVELAAPLGQRAVLDVKEGLPVPVVLSP
jgi:hypothetical protein